MMMHIRGDTFDYVVTFKPYVPDGSLVGFVPTCQVRDMKGNLIANVEAAWVDPVTTRSVSLHVAATQDWKVGLAVFDIQFKRESDSYVRSTYKQQFVITEDVTHP